VTAFNRTAFICNPKIARVYNDAFMSSFFSHSKRVAEVARLTAYNLGIMGSVKLNIPMTTQTHLHITRTGNEQFLRTLCPRFIENEINKGSN
jgi:hypothetical protein